MADVEGETLTAAELAAPGNSGARSPGNGEPLKGGPANRGSSAGKPFLAAPK